MNSLTVEQFTKQYLPRVEQRMANESLDPQLRECGRIVGKAEALNFANQASADGAAWAPRKHVGDGHPLLILTGDMFLSITSEFGPDHIENVSDRELEWGTADKKASFHQHGTSRMPARRFAEVGSEAVDDCRDILTKAFYEMFE